MTVYLYLFLFLTHLVFLFIANPEALLNTVWFNNGMFFALRGRQEHVTLLLGDVEFKKDATGLEYVEFNGKIYEFE